MDKAYFAHESAYVDEGCRIGEGTKIWHFCHVMKGAVIGERCILEGAGPCLHYSLFVGRRWISSARPRGVCG